MLFFTVSLEPLHIKFSCRGTAKTVSLWHLHPESAEIQAAEYCFYFVTNYILGIKKKKKDSFRSIEKKCQKAIASIPALNAGVVQTPQVPQHYLIYWCCRTQCYMLSLPFPRLHFIDSDDVKIYIARQIRKKQLLAQSRYIYNIQSSEKNYLCVPPAISAVISYKNEVKILQWLLQRKLLVTRKKKR